MQCVECKNFNLRHSSVMEKHGFGKCRFGEPGEFESALHEKHKCNTFAQEIESVVQSRREWLNTRLEARDEPETKPSEKSARTPEEIRKHNGDESS